MQVWILTFNRPKALSRQIKTWGRKGHEVHVFTNYPEMHYEDKETFDLVHQVYFNSLSYKESNSWCARSWNSIFIKWLILGAQEGIFVQDDTECHEATSNLIESNKDRYDLIWGPAGDTFFYMKKSVLAKVGWFDERYLGCYCGDADFLKRAWLNYDRNRLCVEETHDWGFIHNPIGLRNFIRWDLGSKTIDQTYQNQHEELEKLGCGNNKVLAHSQGHFKAKWQTPGNGINGIGPMIQYETAPAFPEIDWYPWATKKYLEA